MLAPIEWINKYANTGTDEAAYVENMVMSGSNVESCTCQSQGVSNVVVGRINSIEKHPDADKLVVMDIDVGDKILNIITGAKNVFEGALVPVAMHGATVYSKNGIQKIKKGEIRGVVSDGMLCSLEELGFSINVIPEKYRDGIFIISEDANLGEDIRDALGLYGSTVDFEITPNRSDCLSITGLARETAACTDNDFKAPDTTLENECSGDINSMIKVRIDTKNCDRYYARVVNDIKIEDSPWEMQKFLMEAGVRPINNIVDITNFVMLELGQPMHAFDYKSLEKADIIITDAEEGEKFTTLDGKERTLFADSLVIRDGDKSIGLGGIMGGENSQIRDNTNVIMLEAANFNASNIRSTSKKISLRSEASQRFEKGLDPNLCKVAIERACHLVEKLGAGVVMEGFLDVYPNKAVPKKVHARVSRINKVLGTDITSNVIKEYLERLCMTVDVKGDDLDIAVPTFRLDINEEVDIIEEIGRLYGFNNLEYTLPKSNNASTQSLEYTLVEKSRNILTGLGASEICCYSFTSPRNILKMSEDDAEENLITLLNPLGEENSVMRSQLLPSMLEVLARNYSKNISKVRAFEIGRVFKKVSKDTDDDFESSEKLKLSLGLYGSDQDFFTLKGIINEYLACIGVKKPRYEQAVDIPSLHRGRAARIYTADKNNPVFLGFIGEIDPDVADDYGIGDRCYAAELDFDILSKESSLDKKYKPLPKHPAIVRDIAVVVDNDVKVAEILDIVWEASNDLLEEIELFDIYRGDQIEEGKKSLAFTLTYRGKDITLTDEEIKPVHALILKQIEEGTGGKLRDI